MSDYILSIGGPLEDEDADEFIRFTEFSVTEATSSMGTWTATLPFQTNFEEEIFSDIWIYYDDELIFRGELESYEMDYESAQTTISGRGLFVELDRDVTHVEFNNTTVYDALVDVWADLDYDGIIHPPNRELYDQIYGSERDHRQLWAWQAGEPIQTENVHIDRNRLIFEEPNTILDDGSDDDQLPQFAPDEPTDLVGMVVVTDEPVDWLRGGMNRLEPQWVKVDDDWQTVEHDRPQRHHIFMFEFDSDDEELGYRPMLENGDEPIEVVRTEVFAPDTDGYVSIDNVELEGTTFEVLQELHELGSYNFAIRDYDSRAVDVFPVGTVNVEPDWQIVSSTRSKDLSNYANRVTVTGARLEDGSSYTATVEHEDEIALMTNRGIGNDGVVEKYEKSLDLETEAEVEDRAERLLAESITERDESGSLEVVPEMVTPGYSYNVSAWGEAFPYGGQIGQNSLYFDGDGSYVEFSFSFPQVSEHPGGHYTFEYLIHPQGLDEMDDEEYYVIHEMVDETVGSWIRLYGDGSVELDGGNDWWADRSPPGVVNNDEAQRLSVVWGSETDVQKVLVNGQVMWETDEITSTNARPYEGTNYVGAKRTGEHAFEGGMDDVRIWTSSNDVQSDEWIFEYAFEDLVQTEVDIAPLGAYFRFNDSSDPGSAHNHGSSRAPDDGYSADIIGPEYQDAVGELEEVHYSLGSGEVMDLDFDISGRIDTELVLAKRNVRRNRRLL